MDEHMKLGGRKGGVVKMCLTKLVLDTPRMRLMFD